MKKLVSVLCILFLIFSLLPKGSTVHAASKLSIVKGTIQKGKSLISNGTVTTVSRQTNKTYKNTIKNGKFQLSVPTGEYMVHSYSDATKKTAGNVYQKFTVSASKPAPTLTIKMKEDNVKGSIQPQSGTIQEGTIHFVKHDKESTNYYTVIKNNKFQLYLEDGKYSAFQYYDQTKGENVHISNTFTVKNGKTDPSDIKISTKPFNVKGSVQIGLKKEINGKVKFACESCSPFTAFSTTVEKGLFQIYLPDGRYKLTSIYNTDDKVNYDYAYEFDVKAGKPNKSMNLIVNKENLFGSIQKGGKPIGSGLIYIEPTSKEGPYYKVVIKEGQFSAFIKDGSYQINRYYDTNQQQTIPFEKPITFMVTKGKPSLEEIQISLKADNVVGTAQKGDRDIVKGSFSAHSADFSKTENIGILNGKFSAYINDGTYTIRQVRDEVNSKTYEIDPITFTIKDGQLSSPFKIQVPEENVLGTVSTSKGVSINGSIIILDSTNGKAKHFKVPIYEGTFKAYLPDGNYVVQTIYDDLTGQKAVDVTFTVKDGKLVSEPLKIIIPDENVSGTITVGNTTAEKGSISLVSSKGISYTLNVQNGKFSMYLPDGSYTIHRYEDFTTPMLRQLNVTFFVMNGKLNVEHLKIALQADNFIGSVMKNGSAIKSGSLLIQSEKGTQSAVIIENGKFKTYLPEGHYKVVTVSDYVNSTNYESDMAFTISNGNSTTPFHFQLKDDNVKFTLIGRNDHLYGRILIKGPNDRSYYFSTKNGSISTYMPDGEYNIVSYYSNQEALEIPLQQSFTVKNGIAEQEMINIHLPENNISGTVVKGTKVISSGYINVYSVYRTYTLSIQDGKINAYLPNGEYTINRVVDRVANRGMEANLSFTVKNGVPSLTPIMVVLSDDNLEGSIKIGSMPGKDGNLVIAPKDLKRGYDVPVKNGEFKEYLPNGEYTITQYYSFDGEYIRKLNIDFKIENGKLAAPLSITLPSNNFAGTVIKGNEPIQSGYMDIRNAAGTESYMVRIQKGSYSEYIPDGKYVIGNVYNSQTLDPHQEKIEFEVKNGIPSISSSIQLKDNNIIGTLKKAGSGLTGMLTVSNENNSVGKNVMIKDGQFSTYLPDGTYFVRSFQQSDYRFFKSFDSYTFIVKDGKLTQPLEIALPEDNFVGKVMKAGTVIKSGYVVLRNKATNQYQYVAIANEKYSESLLDGDYEISSVHIEDQSEQHREKLEFQVRDGKVSLGSTIQLKDNNVTGTVMKGSTGISGRIFLKSKDGEIYQNMNIVNGTFIGYLSDNTYIITSIWNVAGSNEVFEETTFTVVDGKLSGVLNIAVH